MQGGYTSGSSVTCVIGTLLFEQHFITISEHRRAGCGKKVVVSVGQYKAAQVLVAALVKRICGFDFKLRKK